MRTPTEQQAEQVYLRIERTDLAEQTYRVLRERIFKRQITVGEKISVDGVATQLGISRTPVTEALQRLAREGLVEIVPQRGTFVTELTAHDVAELFDVRLMIEVHAAESVVAQGKTGQFLDDAQKPIARMKQAMVNGDYGDYEAFITGDQDLHMALIRCTGNNHLVGIYCNLNVHIDIARAHYIDSVERAQQAYREHEAILEAFRGGEPEMVRQALHTHIGNVQNRLLEIVEKHGGSL